MNLYPDFQTEVGQFKDSFAIQAADCVEQPSSWESGLVALDWKEFKRKPYKDIQKIIHVQNKGWIVAILIKSQLTITSFIPYSAQLCAEK